MEPDDLLSRLVDFFERHGVAYFVTGSVAAMAYGEPRFTNDVDVVADLREAHADALADAFPPPDFYVSRPTIRAAIHNRHQFNVLHITAGMKADIILPHATEFDVSRLSRCARMPLGIAHVPMLASPEDVILKKLEYYREGGSEKHLRDITGILKLCPRPIDLQYTELWATKLGVLDIWKMILKRLDQSSPEPPKQP